jgi:hypothetical protein
MAVAVRPTGQFCWCRSAISRADQEGWKGRQAEQHGDQSEAERTGEHLHRPEPKDVGCLGPDVRQREMQADVEEEENDAEFRQQLHGRAVRNEHHARAAESDAERQITDDRA